MQITSDFNSEIRSLKIQPGGYEWWYFDAVDKHDTYRLVIIFYEGNPFSTRYMRALERKNPSEKVLPEWFPAVSISIYKDGIPVYYSFTEFGKDDAEFSPEAPRLRIGRHEMEGRTGKEKQSFCLKLEETLPSGDALHGELFFESPEVKHRFFSNSGEATGRHFWNLAQPRADVSGRIKLDAGGESYETIEFRGTGYHDHNMGGEPLRNEFKDWYWGRFHFEEGTLVYYVMNRETGQQHQAWLISKDNEEVIQYFDTAVLKDKGLNLFGLNVARRITLSNEEAQVMIQQTRVMDNGPFYQRFDSDAFLTIPGRDILETCSGISEYLRPGRICWRLFWPLVNMRIRFNGKSTHWVQKSQTLYRWTW